MHSIVLREIRHEMGGMRWADQVGGIWFLGWWNLVSGEASASVRAGFVQLDPPVDGSAGLGLSRSLELTNWMIHPGLPSPYTVPYDQVPYRKS